MNEQLLKVLHVLKYFLFHSLFATCKKGNVNPHQWKLDTLAKLNDQNYEGSFSGLLAYRWKLSNSPLIAQKQ